MEAEIRLTDASMAVAQQALGEAKESMPVYAHPLLGKEFTQHQLFAIITLQRFLKTDYQGIIQLLADSPDLCKVLGFEELPDYATLFHAEERLVRKGFLEEA